MLILVGSTGIDCKIKNHFVRSMGMNGPNKRAGGHIIPFPKRGKGTRRAGANPYKVGSRPNVNGEDNLSIKILLDDLSC